MKNRISFAIFLLLVHLSAWAQIGGDYNPNNPSDPGNPTQEYTLTLKASPSNGGTFNTTSTNIAGGKTYNLRAYPSTDFAFVAWICNGDTLSKSSSYTYTMPYHDVEITGAFIYSPSNPSDPQEQAQKYTLTLKASPTDGGSFNTSSSRVSVGERFNLRAYPNTDFAFVAWLCDGDTLSKVASYDYTMPSHNVDITGVFTYRPSSPSDPQEQALKYQLSLVAEPMNSGSFNISNERLAVGSNNSLRAYSNTDFVFSRWTIGDSVLSTNPNMDFVMPSHNVQIIGHFEYNPANPANPNANYWNKLTGEVIVDDFTPGYLSSTISTVISGSSSNDVQMITVSGKINSNDFGVANNYKNCSLLDLSRVTGITEVPSYAFDYTNLETVYLPSSIEKIGARAFADCSKLSSITVYAMTPPTLESGVFQGVPDGIVVYVPAAAIAQYQDDETWGKFTLLPIQEDIRSISISLPEGANAADYAQMWLELTNTKSGQRMHYVMTDRQTYTFANIIRNTSWNVTLRNERGDVFGQIDNVEVKDEDVSVTFASLSKPQSVALSVLTPDGQDVTAQTQITWTDSKGNYLAQSVSLTGLPVGYQATYRIVLSQELAMAYNTPQPVEYILTDGNNSITCQLNAIPQVKISGKVKDASTGFPLSGAVVSASQTFSKKYSKTLNAKTDGNGVFTLDIANVPTSVAFSASDYVSQTVNCDSLLTEVGEVTLPDVSLKTITGATITLGFTYTPCDGETQNWYNDYQNVSYTLYNITRDKPISQYNVQYPQIVLLEEVEDGDALRLTATSRTNAFKAVEATANISEQRAEATFDIVELGQIRSTFTTTGNASVVGSLYDTAGKLVKTYDYSNASLTINDLADGNYTLISMGSSRLFNTIYDLAQLSQTGLIEGTDYVQNKVEVKSGQVSAISISEVPTLDESKLYYTDDNTSFTVNKPSIVAGNYLTLTGRIDFKPAYATSISNVQMIVDLPESCEFVENSVMVGNSTSSYTLNGNRISIPMARYTDRVRFCIIPTLGGDYASSAFVQFNIDDETVTQPIGSANYSVKDLSISVPSTVAKTVLPVNGTAIGTSNIEIYDNNVLIGQTMSIANGTWATTCELNEPYNLSMHNIYAKITTKAGLELISETKQVMYDVNMIVPEKVTMLYYNPEYVGQYNIVFDLINKTVSPKSYYFFPYKSYPNWQGSGTEPKDFTFIADLSNNDSTAVDGVTIRVYTSNGYWRNIEAQYNTSMNRWVAVSQFVEEEAPVGVDVVFSSLREITLDDSYLQNEYSWLNSFEKMTVEVDSIVTEKDEYEDWSDEDFLNYLHNQQDSTLEIEEYDCKGLNEYTIVTEDRRTITVKMTSCLGIEESSVANDEEYIKILISSGTSLYVKRTENLADYIDFGNDVRMTLLIEGNENIASSRRAINEDGILYVSGCISAFGGLINSIDDQTRFLRNALENMSIGYNMDYTTAMKGYEKYENIVKALEKRYLNPINSNWANTWAIELHGAYGMKNMYYEAAQKALKSINTIKAVLGKLSSIISFTVNARKGYNAMVEWRGILMNLQNNDCPGTDALYAKAVSYTRRIFGFYYAAASADLASLISLKGKLTGVISLALFNISIHSSNWGDWMHNQWTHEIRMQIPTLKCNDKCPKCGKNPCECKDKCPKCGKNPCECKPPYPQINPIHDPSGYVYEAVSSNRVEGVTASCYYKETVEDMYGDLHENVVLWNAEDYAQKNPLFTDGYGMYRWDVPQGLWQVKFEKEGYETTYSEWLPVPPPQLDVNIAMKQNRQPEVKAARAYEDAVEVEFDKYMMPELLTTENIMVMQDGTAVEGTVELLNEEVSYEGKAETFASKVRFNVSQPFTEQEITLMVNNRVKSYAGIRMQNNYQQTFTIEQEIKQIVSDSIVTVGYGNVSTIVVSVLPASASKGKTLTVKTSSPMILGVETEQVTIGDDGKAEISVSGELSGTAALTFSVEGTDKSAMTIANVEQIVIKTVATPKASIESGTVVEKGTAITLTCETEGATIYYTLDGSCPCDNTDARRVYDGTPIIINKNVTIKVMAMAPNMYESDVAEFTYIVDGTGIDDITMNEQVQIYPLPVRDKVNISASGKIIKSVTISSLNGIVVTSTNKSATMVTLDVSRIPTGIYIINVTTADSTFSRKILKVE